MALPKLVISLVEFDATKIADDFIRHRGLEPQNLNSAPVRNIHTATLPKS